MTTIHKGIRPTALYNYFLLFRAINGKRQIPVNSICILRWLMEITRFLCWSLEITVIRGQKQALWMKHKMFAPQSVNKLTVRFGSLLIYSLFSLKVDFNMSMGDHTLTCSSSPPEYRNVRETGSNVHWFQLKDNVAHFLSGFTAVMQWLCYTIC